MSSARLDFLLSAEAVRSQSHRVLELCKNGSTHFVYNSERLLEVAALVAKVTRENYPDLKIPFHSRWGHFRAGKKERVKERLQKISDPIERARTSFDLVIPSVLLDAGAGMKWRFQEGQESNAFYSKSEGLALASLAWFDSVGGHVTSQVLERVLPSDIANAFQVSSTNPLLGLEGRAGLLCSLGKTLKNKGMDRPGNLVDRLSAEFGKVIPASGILKELLFTLGSIWPGRLQLEGVSLGDCWEYPFGDDEPLIPFHKLSQWMTYSLIEPLEDAGFQVVDVDGLTGLPEYRNGGLFLDSKLLTLRNPLEVDIAQTVYEAKDVLVIEWRALTVALLDVLVPEVRKIFGFNKAEFPLARMLEGGTWWAGRQLAAKLRNDGGPPLKIKSDGTVF